MNRDETSNAICALINLLINSKPSDGPMVSHILDAALVGINTYVQNGDELSDLDDERLRYLSDIFVKLRNGEYDILPCHPYNDIN